MCKTSALNLVLQNIVCAFFIWKLKVRLSVTVGFSVSDVLAESSYVGKFSFP